MRDHMSNILFRGKRIDNGKWVYGEYWTYRGTYRINDPVKENSYIIDINTRGQFTGLLDKNGVKIFEGDFLQDEDKAIGIVVFDKGRFVGIFDGRTYCAELYRDARESQVIGNIHYNPELLTEGNR